MYIRLITTIHLTTSAQVVEKLVTTTDNSPSKDYTHPIKLHYYSPYKVVITISGLLLDDLVT